jgi:hypothetical protein
MSDTLPASGRTGIFFILLLHRDSFSWLYAVHTSLRNHPCPHTATLLNKASQVSGPEACRKHCMYSILPRSEWHAHLPV